MTRQELISTVCFLLAVPVCIFSISYGGYSLYKYFGPRYEEVRRDIYEESKAYKDGTNRDLQNLQLEYLKADGNVRAALRSTILHRAADFPEEDMTVDLRTFIRELKRENE